MQRQLGQRGCLQGPAVHQRQVVPVRNGRIGGQQPATPTASPAWAQPAVGVPAPLAAQAHHAPRRPGRAAAVVVQAAAATEVKTQVRKAGGSAGRRRLGSAVRFGVHRCTCAAGSSSGAPLGWPDDCASVRRRLPPQRVYIFSKSKSQGGASMKELVRRGREALACGDDGDVWAGGHWRCNACMHARRRSIGRPACIASHCRVFAGRTRTKPLTSCTTPDPCRVPCARRLPAWWQGRQSCRDVPHRPLRAAGPHHHN